MTITLNIDVEVEVEILNYKRTKDTKWEPGDLSFDVGNIKIGKFLLIPEHPLYKDIEGLIDQDQLSELVEIQAASNEQAAYEHYMEMKSEDY